MVFALWVDNFGVKYFNKDDANHLIQTLQKEYVISIDWDGKNYCGPTLDWNYAKQHVDISIPNYIGNALKKFNHKSSKSPQHAPHDWP